MSNATECLYCGTHLSAQELDLNMLICYECIDIQQKDSLDLLSLEGYSLIENIPENDSLDYWSLK